MSFEKQEVYTIKSGNYSVELLEEEIPFISQFFYEVFQADTTTTELEIDGGRAIIQLIESLRDGNLSKYSVEKTKLTTKYMLCLPDNGELRMYRKELKEKLPLYYAIRCEEIEARKAYSFSDLSDGSPNILIELKEIPSIWSQYDNQNIVLDPSMNVVQAKGAWGVMLPNFLYNKYHPKRKSFTEKEYVKSFYDANGILDIFDLPIMQNFCVAGGSLLHYIYDADNRSDIDIFPIGCDEDTVKNAIVDVYNHLRGYYDKESIIISRGKYAISLSFNSYGLSMKDISVATLIMKLLSFSYLIENGDYDWKYYDVQTSYGHEELLNILEDEDHEQMEKIMLFMKIDVDGWKPSDIILGFNRLKKKLDGIDLGRILQRKEFFECIGVNELQFILQNNREVSEVLCRFDIDCCALAVYKDKFYATKRSIYSIANRVNIIDPTRQSPSYIERLIKYRNRGFKIFVPGFNGELMSKTSASNKQFKSGLGALIKAPDIKKSDYNFNTVIIDDINKLFDRVQERDNKKFLFPKKLLYANYKQPMVGSINQIDDIFYNIDSPNYIDNEETSYHIV